MRYNFTLILLLVIIYVDAAPQRDAQDGGRRSPLLDVGSAIISQIHDLSSNFRQRQDQVIGAILQPIAIAARHRRPEAPLDGGEQKGGVKEEFGQAEQPVEDKKRPGGKKQNGGKQKEIERNKNEEKITDSILPPPGAAEPSTSLLGRPEGSKPTTEDWSHVTPSNDKEGVEHITRKIIGAPCLGGTAADGTCRAASDFE